MENGTIALFSIIFSNAFSCISKASKGVITYKHVYTRSFLVELDAGTFCTSLHLRPCFTCARSEGSDENSPDRNSLFAFTSSIIFSALAGLEVYLFCVVCVH